MMNVKLTKGLVVCLIMALLLSVMSIGVFADDEVTGEPSSEVTEEPSAEPSVDSTPEATDEPTATPTTAPAEEKSLSTNAIIGLIIVAALVVAAIVTVCILAISPAKREKFFKFFRGYKSEVKKIVWLPADQTRKSSLVVIVVVAILALVIAGLDIGFSKALITLGDLIN